MYNNLITAEIFRDACITEVYNYLQVRSQRKRYTGVTHES